MLEKLYERKKPTSFETAFHFVSVDVKITRYVLVVAVSFHIKNRDREGEKENSQMHHY